jgi:RNA polymerase sigma-70 factor (ECF subfamily)
MLYLSLIEDEEDKCTFEHIFHSYKDDMIAIAYKVLEDRWDAEDAVQNAMLGLAVSIKRVPTNTEEMRAYSLAAARNAALHLQRKRAKHKNNISLHKLMGVVPCEEDVFEHIVKHEEYETLLRLIDQIPLNMKECLLLRYVADMQPREIAKLLGRKTDTVQKQITRGKAMLVKLYGGDQHENE